MCPLCVILSCIAQDSLLLPLCEPSPCFSESVAPTKLPIFSKVVFYTTFYLIRLRPSTLDSGFTHLSARAIFRSFDHRIGILACIKRATCLLYSPKSKDPFYLFSNIKCQFQTTFSRIAPPWPSEPTATAGWGKLS